MISRMTWSAMSRRGEELRLRWPPQLAGGQPDVVRGQGHTSLVLPAAMEPAVCCAAFRMPMRRALSVPMIGDGIAPPGLPGGAIWLARCRWSWARCRG